MDTRQIREIIDLMIDKDVAELELDQHGVRLHVRRPEVGRAPGGAAAGPPAPLPGTAAPTPGAEDEEDVAARYADAHLIRSPMVGTFYRAPEPAADPFVEEGDVVEEGQTLCIVEAMKLMNEITADVGGEVVAVFPENGRPVEYGQELFAIKPR